MVDVNEIDSLLLEWECDTLDDQGIEHLRTLLKTNSAARSRFIQMQLLTTALHLEADTGATEIDTNLAPVGTTVIPAVQPRFRQTRAWNQLAVSLLLFTVSLLTGWIFYRETGSPLTQSVPPSMPSQRDPAAEATSEGVALLTRLVDVRWPDSQSQIEVGQALPRGSFRFDEGHAQIEFLCGATLIVEGPAHIELQSPTQARVHKGRLRAHVPPAARGFTLQMDDLTVVDLGTEFGLAVSDAGTDVEVFDGEVELHDPSSRIQRLTTGQALVLTDGGEYREKKPEPEKFLDISSLEVKDQQLQSARYARWRAWSKALRNDPRLIAYYSFAESGDWERRLVCSTLPLEKDLDGAIVGAREVPGRWDAKRALEFKQPADRVRVQIPGEYESLTFAAWVKIDSLDRWYNSLFLTDSYDKGEPHWQILDTGQLYFSIRPVDRGEKGPTDYKALSPPFWNPSLNGKWIHLAVTCDLATSTITHYLNGTILSRHKVPPEQLPETTRFGAASIGNWSSPTLPGQRFAIRNLNGALDELIIFSSALSPEEIQEIYQHGKP
ncbi:MAG: iron dicitrate transport regulator FecR [Gimesia sp.]|uniref:Iron dicitrate transport regulator FecR n=1 Tax=Gimesia maris TaxID=122 RepID=A0A3D3RED9_9PLAN|nr:iron dicitrate transport regulator FecR [Gimesia sp.]HCO26468.1 iron dicitrate transport regulator FecR [Gimesia maris]|tara:strand:+ start:4516 stop:6171 length:1656 start_codon:yes stop_codon:yes gene_type:complete